MRIPESGDTPVLRTYSTLPRPVSRAWVRVCVAAS